MPGPGSVACPKPRKGSAKRAKAARRRREAAVAEVVREKVEARDGQCRLAVVVAYNPAARAVFGPCGGPSEWAHIGDKKRFKTRGMAPEKRHTTEGSVKFCHDHHQGPRGYDRGGFRLAPLSDRGADGPLRYWVVGAPYYDEEPGRFVV